MSDWSPADWWVVWRYGVGGVCGGAALLLAFAVFAWESVAGWAEQRRRLRAEMNGDDGL